MSRDAARIPGWLICVWTTFDIAKCDEICRKAEGFPLNYCYGVTAYCCGEHHEDCCWEQIWKIWWFWVVAVVVGTALFSCCGYYCCNFSDDGHSTILRNDSFRFFHRFRRLSTRDYMPMEDEWKPPPHVTLPPYSPAPPTTSTDEQVPPQTVPYLDPPPPYTTVASHPQPESSNENTALLPVAPAERHNEPKYNATTSQ